MKGRTLRAVLVAIAFAVVAGTPHAVVAASESATRSAPVLVAAGQVESLDASSSTALIAGQRVRGVAGAELGSHVVVFGSVLDDGSVAAAQVVPKGAYVAGASTVILTGVVRRVDVSTGRALVGSAWIDYTPAMSGAFRQPRAGELAHVQGVQPVARGLVLATLFRSVGPTGEREAAVRTLGLSSELPRTFWSDADARGVAPAMDGISTGTNGISTGTNGISTGTNGISTGTNGISTGTNGISTGTNGISTGTNGISTGTNGISTGTNGISTGTNGISTGTNGISTGTNGISTGTNGISTGTNGISTGTNGISTGTNGISTGTNGISTGTNGISTGTNGISTGTGVRAQGISTGTNGISTGTNGISTGTGVRAQGISTGTNGISTGTNGISTGTNGISTGTNGISTGTNGVSAGTGP